MGRLRLVGLACALSLGLTNVAAAQVEVKNDGFVSGGVAGFQGGFVSGEIGAVTLVPTGNPPFRVHKVRLLWGPSASAQDVQLRIYEDTVGNLNPGIQLFSGDYQLTGSAGAFIEIDLTSDNVMVSGVFRVGIVMMHSGDPSIARDADGAAPNFPDRNFIFTSTLGWQESALFGLQGDWVIRADVTDTPPTADAGVPPDAMMVPDAAPGTPDGAVVVPDAGVGSPDASPGSPDAGGGDQCQLNSDCSNGNYCDEDGICTFDCRVDLDCASGNVCSPVGRCVEPADDGGGCGCRSSGSNTSTLALLLLAGMLAIRRRRRQ